MVTHVYCLQSNAPEKFNWQFLFHALQSKTLSITNIHIREFISFFFFFLINDEDTTVLSTRQNQAEKKLKISITL